jgi:hypothetical protein
MSAPTRYRIRERYWTVAEIAVEAHLTLAGVWARIKAGATGEALLQRVPDKAATKAERAIRRRLAAMAKAKYKRTCPNCGCAFDMFQPAHMLKTIKP